MAGILALGLGAAVYPQLLAIVVVILTRPNPKRLLSACYAAAVCVSVGAGIAVLLAFRDRSSVAGSTSHRLGASAYLVIGAIALLAAILMASERGRALLGANLRWVRSRGRKPRGGSRSTERAPGRAERLLHQGSVLVAVGVGAVLGIPGPFDLLALGRLTRGGYGLIASIGVVIAFNLIKFLLIEVPLLSYAIDPKGTAGRVEGFSAWLRIHRIKVIAAVVGLVGLVLIGRGITRLG
jgi:hypothetical protein